MQLTAILLKVHKHKVFMSTIYLSAITWAASALYDYLDRILLRTLVFYIYTSCSTQIGEFLQSQ